MNITPIQNANNPFTSTPAFSQNSINTEDLSVLIEIQYRFLVEHPETSSVVPPVFIHGAPGIGKSQIIRSVAEKLGIGFIDIRLSQREPVDIRGLPVPDPEGKTVGWLVSSDWPRDPASRGLILFDELSSADKSLQVAAYEMILDRRLGSLYTLPDGWYIVAAGNRTEDDAVTVPMSSALANRFMHFDLRVDSEAWIRWGLENGISPSILGYIRWRPDSLHKMEGENIERGWPSPRSWERVSVMERIYESNIDSHIFNRAVCGLVGAGVGTEYLSFKKMSRRFDDVRKLMLTPGSTIEIPQQADEKYAFCAAVAHHLWIAKDEAEQNQLIDSFYKIELKLPGDFATMLMIDALNDGSRSATSKLSSGKAMKLLKHKSFKEWEKMFGKQMRSKLNI